MYDRSKANPANFQADDGSQHEASIAPDPEPVEAPVDKDDGEPLVEDRVVPCVADEIPQFSVHAGGGLPASPCH